MSEQTNFGGTFSISEAAANSDLTLSGFTALTFVLVPNIGNHGPSGVSQNVVSFSTWDRNVASKGKGEANAGDPTVTFLDIVSAGMTLMLAAADVDDSNSYGFKVTWPDGSVEYNRGIVTGPARPKGGNEDFKTLEFTLGFNQVPVIVDAT